jgi:pimeloyl-ACP methyl ester carboxylesterase
MTPAASAEHIEYRELRIRGLRIHAQTWGQGEPLLLHSPIWADAGMWEPLLPHLAGFRTIAFDPPGIGRSPMPALPMSMRALASWPCQPHLAPPSPLIWLHRGERC